MRIWLINHYAVPPQYYPLARPSLFAKNLIMMGHDVTIIAASTVHNSDINLIEGREKVKKFIDDGIPYILIRCSDYQGNGAKRVINILEFARKLPRVLDTIEKPDAIVATSFDPLSCYAGIKYAKKRGIKAVAEIADLWPETLVAYNGLKPSNPIVKFLRSIEKNIYTQADRVVFTMEGAYDYIVEQGWDVEIPREKVEFINNGIEIKEFDTNRETYTVQDADLNDDSVFKVVYTGAVRKVNNLGLILDAAKLITDPQVRILIWGDGDELEYLKKRVTDEKITNVSLKGKVPKRFVPYITSKADLNILHNSETPIMRFGLSLNKMFDYMAAGKPILVDFHGNNNPVIDNAAGIETDGNTASNIANGIIYIKSLPDQDKINLGFSARKTAEKYDFDLLTDKLIRVIESI